MDPGELISVGKITGTHGWKGMVKVFPLTDFPQRFIAGQRIWAIRDQQSPDELWITEARPYKKLVLIRFKNISSKEEAEMYRNALLKVPEDELYPLPPHHYYHFQLLGLAVFDHERGYLGQLASIIETGANDVYVIHSPDYGEVLIPAIKDVVLEVDLQEKKMMIQLIPGLLSQED